MRTAVVYVTEARRSTDRFEGNADYGRMVQPSQQHVVPCVKEVEWGLGKERFENACSVLDLHSGRAYPGG